MTLATKEPVPKTPVLGQQYIRGPVGTEGTARKPSLYARIIETAHAYPVAVPQGVENEIAEEFRLGQVEILHDPFAAFIYAKEGVHAPEFVVRKGLEKNGYALSVGRNESVVTRDDKAVLVLISRDDQNGYDTIVAGDIKSMISGKIDENIFDMLADLLAA